MTTEHTLQQLKEIAEGAVEAEWFNADELHRWFFGRYTAAHVAAFSPRRALDLIAQVEKRERLLWELAREIHDERGCMCEEDERGSRNLCAPCQVADLLGSPGKWKIDPSVPDEPVKEGTEAEELKKATALNMELTSAGGLIIRSQKMRYDERALGHCITFTDWLTPPYKILKRILDAKDGTAKEGAGQ